MNVFTWISGWLFSLCIVVVICASLVYSCNMASERYYAAQSACMQNGGTWIAANAQAGSYDAHCIRNYKIN